MKMRFQKALSSNYTNEDIDLSDLWDHIIIASDRRIIRIDLYLYHVNYHDFSIDLFLLLLDRHIYYDNHDHGDRTVRAVSKGLASGTRPRYRQHVPL